MIGMDEQDEQRSAAGVEPEPRGGPPPSQSPSPGRAARGPDEGPANGGGSALEADEEAATEEIGGGD